MPLEMLEVLGIRVHDIRVGSAERDDMPIRCQLNGGYAPATPPATPES
jgi:hypothetical protein